MSAQGFNIAEEGHVVNVLPPVDINGSAQTGDRFTMENAAHASIILTIGASSGTTTVTVKNCTAASGGTATAIAFKYYAEETASGDTLGERASATSSGFATDSGTDNITYVIEIDGADLTDGYPWIELNLSNPSASVLASAVAVLSGLRYAGEANQTAIA